MVSYGLTPDNTAVSVRDVVTPEERIVALLLGSEREGLDEATMVQATELLRIPMHAGVDSLNVGAAAAIAMYALGPRN